MGGENILLNWCKWLQINRLFLQAITARLRSETILPIKWIAVRVQIGPAKGAKAVLPHLAQSRDQRKTASALEPCAQLEFQSTVFQVVSFLSRAAIASLPGSLRSRAAKSDSCQFKTSHGQASG